MVIDRSTQLVDHVMQPVIFALQVIELFFNRALVLLICEAHNISFYFLISWETLCQAERLWLLRGDHRVAVHRLSDCETSTSRHNYIRWPAMPAIRLVELVLQSLDRHLRFA